MFQSGGSSAVGTVYMHSIYILYNLSVKMLYTARDDYVSMDTFWVPESSMLESQHIIRSMINNNSKHNFVWQRISA